MVMGQGESSPPQFVYAEGRPMKKVNFRFVHLTDTHIQPELGAPQAWKKAIQLINALQLS
jgi:hypothetical protein